MQYRRRIGCVSRSGSALEVFSSGQMQKKNKSAPYFVYILECGDGSLYTGITTDVKRRFSEHKSGTGSNFTRARGAKRIVYTEKQPNRSSAQKREAEIKRLPRGEKLALIK
ncbi:MAG: Excinuclease ABC subunit C domain-containing protein [Parcubacteria group bacterium Gr01-1014_91]|nr:MAG: Excinuclease ABC subunit C domain-containing protein [Parcubacteria group bacterium Gr01-1014_91]